MKRPRPNCRTRIRRLQADLRAKHRLILAMAERIAVQSELLSKRAEKRT